MIKFTPGPWRVADGSDSDMFCEFPDILGKRLNNALAVVAKANPGVGGGGEEGRANACLIAAAPDMYEALVYFKEYMTGPKDLQVLLHMVDQAIAKAEGQL